MKKRLIALLAAGLSIIACGSLEGTPEPETGAPRLYSGKYDNAYYIIHFKNGGELFHYVSGYDLDPYTKGGKVTLYNYWNSEVKEIDGLLNNLNIIHSAYTTPTGSYAYGRNEFDTSNIYGVGGYGYSLIFADELDIWYEYPTDDDLYQFCLEGLDNAQYLKPYTIPVKGAHADDWFANRYKGVIDFQKTNPKAALFISFMDKITLSDEKLHYLIQSPIQILHRTDRSLILDASNIYRFAFNDKNIF